MYFIVSATKNYKPKCKINLSNPFRFRAANTLGHELCLTRPLVMILLSMNLINREDTIVTQDKRRFFLYSNIFKNVIGYDDIPSNIEDSQIIDICDANIYYNTDKDLTNWIQNNPEWSQLSYKQREELLLCVVEKIDGKRGPPMQIMEITDLERRFPIMTKIRNKEINYRTELFNSLMTNINYVDCSYLIKKDFVIVHHRVVSYHSESKNTHDIVSAIKAIDPDIQIFIFSIKHLQGFLPDVTFIDDLPTYASLLNDEKCKGLFTEFSGGGIVGHFCHNKKIFYLETAYKIYEESNIYEVIIEGNNPNNLYGPFGGDMKLFTTPSIYIFKDIDSFLKEFKQYYFDKETKILRV